MKICMYCGENPRMGDHEACRARLQIFREDLKRTPAKEKWKIFRAAELGHYGSVKKPDTSTTGMTQPWEPLAQQLRAKGLQWTEIADALNAAGFTTKGGKKLDAGRLLNREWYRKKKGK